MMKWKAVPVLALALFVACAPNPDPQPPSEPTARPDGSPTAAPRPTDDPLKAAAVKAVALFCPNAYAGDVTGLLVRARACERYLAMPVTFASCLCRNTTPAPTATQAAAPTATQTAAPTATATRPPTLTPTPEVEKTEPTKCDSRQSSYIGNVRKEMQAWKDAHPYLWTPTDKGDMLVWCAPGHEVDYPCPISQDVFLLPVADALKKYRLEGILDGDSGDLVVASATAGFMAPDTFAETFHPISSWDDLKGTGRIYQSAPYLGWCTPRWIAWKK